MPVYSILTYLFSGFVPCHGSHDQFVSLFSMVPQLLPCQCDIVNDCSYQVRVIVLYTNHGLGFVGNLNNTVVGFLKIKFKIDRMVEQRARV